MVCKCGMTYQQYMHPVSQNLCPDCRIKKMREKRLKIEILKSMPDTVNKKFLEKHL